MHRAVVVTRVVVRGRRIIRSSNCDELQLHRHRVQRRSTAPDLELRVSPVKLSALQPGLHRGLQCPRAWLLQFADASPQSQPRSSPESSNRGRWIKCQCHENKAGVSKGTTSPRGGAFRRRTTRDRLGQHQHSSTVASDRRQREADQQIRHPRARSSRHGVFGETARRDDEPAQAKPPAAPRQPDSAGSVEVPFERFNRWGRRVGRRPRRRGRRRGR